jgi:hypothetical protein
LPARHGEQAAAGAEVKKPYVPGAHQVQVEAPARGACEPSQHATHRVPAAAGWYLPGGQSWQAPPAGEKVPAAQAAQSLPA